MFKLSAVMQNLLTNSFRHLLIILFFVFETLFVASVIGAFCTKSSADLSISLVFGFAFWFSLLGQLVVCFLLRRRARPLAIVGWITLFAGFWSLVLFPRL